MTHLWNSYMHMVFQSSHGIFSLILSENWYFLNFRSIIKSFFKIQGVKRIFQSLGTETIQESNLKGEFSKFIQIIKINNNHNSNNRTEQKLDQSPKPNKNSKASSGKIYFLFILKLKKEKKIIMWNMKESGTQSDM